MGGVLLHFYLSHPSSDVAGQSALSTPGTASDAGGGGGGDWANRYKCRAPHTNIARTSALAEAYGAKQFFFLEPCTVSNGAE